MGSRRDRLAVRRQAGNFSVREWAIPAPNGQRVAAASEKRQAVHLARSPCHGKRNDDFYAVGRCRKLAGLRVSSGAREKAGLHTRPTESARRAVSWLDLRRRRSETR